MDGDEQIPPYDTWEEPIDHIFRWDLDKTYLRTEFDTISDLIRTALQTPEEKVNVPGAVELLRELDGRAFKERRKRTLVTFISGSPSQMREKLEKKFELDGIEPDIFILKPTLRYILTGRFSAIRGQVGYKLDTLLKLRAATPLAPETMFGDDAEQDAFIYSVYADLSAGRLDVDQLREILAEAQVDLEAAASILERAENTEIRETARRIFIHLDQRTPPGRFWVFGPRVVPIVNYFQAALVLFSDETLPAKSVLRVAAGMTQHHSYGLTQLANSFEDLMRRRHLGLDVVDRLAEEAEEADATEALPKNFVDRLLNRARSLAPRSTAPSRNWSGPPDYLDVLRSDKALRESVREEKKSGLFG